MTDFLQGAQRQSFGARRADATARQRNWEAEQALGRLLPSFTARGVFTHNQYEAALPPGTFPGQTEAITITPQNQFDATFQLDVPLLDLSSYQRLRQARHLAEAAELSRDATDNNLNRAVCQAYFTFLGAEALVDASEQSLTLAEGNLSYVDTRVELGAATELDQARAQANVERAKQDIADAQLLRITAVRNLETLSGISATAAQSFPVDDLREEAPLTQWLSEKDAPEERVQVSLDRAARAAKKASAYALLPTLSASAQERFSNASGFSGQNTSYALSAILTWRLDYGTYAGARAQSAAADVQAISGEEASRTVDDSIYDAYHRVEANIAKSRAARAQADASVKAAALAQDRYRAGAVTQLDVIQSQRDAFSAQAARIKSDADLALSRILLRISAGKPAILLHSSTERRLPPELSQVSTDSVTPQDPPPDRHDDSAPADTSSLPTSPQAP